MLVQALSFLVDTVLGLYSGALLIRFYLQVARAPARNPISQFIVALTDPVVRPARRFIPGWAGLDLSTLVLAWLTQVLLLVVLALLRTGLVADGFPPLLAVFAMAAVEVLRMSLYILIGALILQAVLSWVAPHSPMAPVINGLTRPFLRPIQRRIPPVGNVDLSPLVLLIVVQLVLMVPVNWLAGLVARLFGG